MRNGYFIFRSAPVFIALVRKIETLLEAIYSSACINKLLLTSKEWMALRADFHLNILLCGLCFDHIPAVACNGSFVQGRMDIFFHTSFTSL